MSDYGLPDTRNPDGSRKEQDHTFEWNGQEVTIKIDPPTITQFQEYEQLDGDANADDLITILDEHLVKPEIEDGDWRMDELFCYLFGIMDHGKNGGGEVAKQVRAEIEEREATAGN